MFSRLKKEKYCLYDYIFTIIGNISYNRKFIMLIKYLVYTFIVDEDFNNFNGELINFNESEINLDAEV